MKTWDDRMLELTNDSQILIHSLQCDNKRLVELLENNLSFIKETLKENKELKNTLTKTVYTILHCFECPYYAKRPQYNDDITFDIEIYLCTKNKYEAINQIGKEAPTSIGCIPDWCPMMNKAEIYEYKWERTNG